MDNSRLQNSQQVDCDFYVDSSNPLTLIMLRRVDSIQQLRHKIPPNIFPNFIFLHKPTKANLHKSSLMAMLAHQTQPSVSVPQFCRLARACLSNYHLPSINLFEQKYKSMQLPDSIEVILEQYTQESFFYGFINNLLRSGKNCLELFYGQYFVKSLYQAIKQFEHTESVKQFVCYRGATVAEHEIEDMQRNIGKYIETLGFLSTSLAKDVAETFIGNTLIEISVKDRQRHRQIDSKYAVLGYDSEHPEQKQVLFNALSSFKIISVSLVSNIWQIKLQYGVTSEILQKYDNKQVLSVEQAEIIPLILHQRREFPLSNFGQSKALASDKSLKKQSQLYLKNILQLYEAQPNKKSNLVYDYFQNQLFLSYSSSAAKQPQDIKFIDNFTSRLLQQIQTTCYYSEELITRYQKIESVVQRHLVEHDCQRIQQLILVAKYIIEIIPNFATDQQNIQEWVKQRKTQVSIWQLLLELEKVQDLGKQVLIQKILKLKQEIEAQYGQNHHWYKEILFIYWRIATDFQYPSIIKRGGGESLQFQKLQRTAISEDFNMLFYYEFYSYISKVERSIQEKQYDKAVKLTIEILQSEIINKIETPAYITRICGPAFQLVDRLVAELLLEQANSIIRSIKLIQQSRPQLLQAYVLQILSRKAENLEQHKKLAWDILCKEFCANLSNLAQQYYSSLIQLFVDSFIATSEKILGKASPHCIICKCLKINGLKMLGRYEEANDKLQQLLQEALTLNLQEDLIACIEGQIQYLQ